MYIRKLNSSSISEAFYQNMEMVSSNCNLWNTVDSKIGTPTYQEVQLRDNVKLPVGEPN